MPFDVCGVFNAVVEDVKPPWVQLVPSEFIGTIKASLLTFKPMNDEQN